jgi:predicted transcriptional regulator
MISKKSHWEILRVIADENEVSFEGLVRENNFPQKDVYDVLRTLNEEQILIPQSERGIYQVDEAKMIVLLKRHLPDFIVKSEKELTQFSKRMNPGQRALFVKLREQGTLQREDYENEEHGPLIQMLVTNNFVVTCVSKLFLALDDAQTDRLIGQKTEEPVLEEPEKDMRYEDIIKKFKKS